MSAPTETPAPAFVADLLEAEQAGLYTELELFAELFRQLDHRNVDAVIAALPPELRRRFAGWARARYDNTADPAALFHIGGEGSRPMSDEALAGIRAWLRRPRGAAG